MEHDPRCPRADRPSARCQCALIALVRAEYVHQLGPAEQAALDEIRGDRD